MEVTELKKNSNEKGAERTIEIQPAGPHVTVFNKTRYIDKTATFTTLPICHDGFNDPASPNGDVVSQRFDQRISLLAAEAEMAVLAPSFRKFELPGHLADLAVEVFHRIRV